MEPACIFEGSTENTDVVIASSSSSGSCTSLEQVEISVKSTFLKQEKAKYSIVNGELKDITEDNFENNVLISRNDNRRKRATIGKPMPEKIEIWVQFAFDKSLKERFLHFGSETGQIKKKIKELFSIAKEFFQKLPVATTIKLLMSEDILFIDQQFQVTDSNLTYIRKYQQDPTIPLIVICADDQTSDIKGLAFR